MDPERPVCAQTSGNTNRTIGDHSRELQNQENVLESIGETTDDGYDYEVA